MLCFHHCLFTDRVDTGIMLMHSNLLILPGHRPSSSPSWRVTDQQIMCRACGSAVMMKNWVSFSLLHWKHCHTGGKSTTAGRFYFGSTRLHSRFLGLTGMEPPFLGKSLAIWHLEGGVKGGGARGDM